MYVHSLVRNHCADVPGIEYSGQWGTWTWFMTPILKIEFKTGLR